MKVILAADAIRAPLTGIGRYAYELARGLHGHPAVDELKLMSRVRWHNHPDELIQPMEMPNKASAPPHPVIRTLGRALLPPLKWMRCRPYKDFIYHSPNYALPPFSGKRVSTIHDLSVIRHPEFHPEERVNHLLRLFPSILRRGDLFLTDSNFSRDEIIDYFKIDPDRVIAIPLGVESRYTPQDPSLMDAVLPRYGLQKGHYCLSVGTIEPRKNLKRLLIAYRGLPLSQRQAFPLVLVGSEGWNSEGIHHMMQEAQREGWLRYLAYVQEQDLPALYAGARIFICVSLYEGFGLPVLEAMACGTPILCSLRASLPEVAGECALYVEADDPEAIHDGLLKLIDDEEHLLALKTKGLERSKAFTWNQTVSKTIAAYQRLIS